MHKDSKLSSIIPGTIFKVQYVKEAYEAGILLVDGKTLVRIVNGEPKLFDK